MSSNVPQSPSSGTEWERSSEWDNATLRRPETSEEPTFIHRENLFSLKMPGSDGPQHYNYRGSHGPPIDNLDPQHDLAEEEYNEHEDLMWARVRHYIRDPAAEFLGTMIMIIFGDGSVAQVVLSANKNLPESAQNKGDYQSISWGWGIGVMMGVYVAGCAGGHLNPAVTLVNCIFRGFPWKKLPLYALAQVLGCFCGAAIIYGNYESAIDVYEGGPGVRTVPGFSDTATAGVFCTYPAPFMTRVGMFFSEFIASAVLIFVIFALKDDGNLGAGNLVPIALFFLIFGIGATLGWETGYAINLARDFGPRLLSYAVGYGTNVFRAGGWYFWIPMVSPFIGCTFGGALYDALLYEGETPMNKILGKRRSRRALRRSRPSDQEIDAWREKRKGGAGIRGDLEAGNGTGSPQRRVSKLTMKDSGVAVAEGSVEGSPNGKLKV